MDTPAAILEELTDVLRDYTVDELRDASRKIDARTSRQTWFGTMVEEHIAADNREAVQPATGTAP